MPNFGLNQIRRGVPRNKVHRPYIKLNEKKISSLFLSPTAV